MFCPKCGTEVPDNNNFCTNCGNQINFDNNNSPHNKHSHSLNEFKNFTNLIKNAIIHPYTACIDFIKELTTKETIIYFGIMSLIISLVQTLSFKNFMSNIIESIIVWVTKMESYTYSITPSALTQIRNQINSVFSQLFPTGSLFVYNLFSILVFYLLIIAITYLIYTVLMKKHIHFIDYLKIATVVITLNTFLIILSSVILILNAFLGFILLSLSSVIIMIMLFAGLRNLVTEDNKTVYIFSVTYFLVNFIRIYLLINMIIDKFISNFRL